MNPFAGPCRHPGAGPFTSANVPESTLRTARLRPRGISMSDNLMTSRRFAPLFWCQFFSAFNDNFLKNALVFLILFAPGVGNREALITLTAAIFIGPFFFLSGFGGQLADRFDKSIVASRVKFVEIAVSALGVVGFWLHSIPIMFVTLFLFGVIATLFGPVKYGILPDHLKKEELPAGNALVEGATFMAILLGTIMGGLAAKEGNHPAYFGAMIVVFSFLCWGASLLIPRTGQGAPNLYVDPNIARSTGSLLCDLWIDKRLWWGCLVTSWFWLVDAVALSLMPPLVKLTVGASEEVVTAYLAVFSIAIAVGSLLAAWLSHGRIALFPTLVGAFFLAVFALDLGFATYGVSAAPGAGIGQVFSSARGIHVAIDLAGLAIAGGLFIVPVFSAVQSWAGADKRARVIAGVNVLNALFIVGGTLIVAALQAAGATLPQLFLLIGAANLIALFIIARTMPANGLRDFLTTMLRALYRMEVKGAENFTNAGPNPIVALNHVSFLDAAVALSLMDKEQVFAIDYNIAQRWWVKPFLNLTRAMPLDPSKPMATRTLINAVKAGEPLVIFPEGRITVTGSLMKVYDGVGLIAEKSGALVVPVKIDGLEATPFSRLSRAQVHRRWFPKVTVTVLPPVKLAVAPELKGRNRRQAAGAALYEIMSDLVFRTTSTDRTVFDAVVEAADVHGLKRIAVEDPLTGSLSYKKMLIGASVLGRKLMPLAAEGKALGVMLPNANGAVVTILGVMSAGRVPAMINFTAGASSILAACKAAEVGTILTSRAFVDKGRLDAVVTQLAQSVTIVYLEDVRATVTTSDKLRALMTFRRPLN